MPIDYSKQRKRVTPPHADLRSLRVVSRMTLDQVCSAVNDVEPRLTLTRGALSAIENGHRGASVEMLNALTLAYGLQPGSLTTNYEPRATARIEELAS